MVAVPATADYDAGFNSIKVHLTETMTCCWKLDEVCRWRVALQVCSQVQWLTVMVQRLPLGESLSHIQSCASESFYHLFAGLQWRRTQHSLVDTQLSSKER